MIKFITYLIPVEIKIKTLYWKKIENEIQNELDIIFNKIDNNELDNIQILISNFRNKWGKIKLPLWLELKTMEINRAQFMLNFIIDSPLI
jgi:hypothetical protein